MFQSIAQAPQSLMDRCKSCVTRLSSISAKQSVGATVFLKYQPRCCISNDVPFGVLKALKSLSRVMLAPLSIAAGTEKILWLCDGM